MLGLDGYKNIIDELKQRNIEIPVYAIGGILLEDIPSLMQLGIYGVAMSGIITNNNEKELLVQQINTFLYE